jgi:hypothetical protein
MFHTLKRHCFNAKKVRILSQSNFSSEQMLNFCEANVQFKKAHSKIFLSFHFEQSSNVCLSKYLTFDQKLFKRLSLKLNIAFYSPQDLSASILV